MRPGRRPADRFRSRYGTWALVAGGSDGLGLAFAAQAAARGLDLVLVARRPEPLGSAAELVRRRHGVRVRTVTADLGEPGTFGDVLPPATEGLEIGLVVANAAYAPVGPFLALDAAAAARVIRLNCEATVLLARQFLPAMVARGRGGFVVVSSAAGLQGLPGVTEYAATKAFGRVLAEGLWAELRPHGVDVLACVAGAVRTPAFERSGLAGAPGMLTPDRVAAEAYSALGRVPTVVPGRLTRLATRVLGLLPRSTAVTVMRRASRDLRIGSAGR